MLVESVSGYDFQRVTALDATIAVERDVIAYNVQCTGVLAKILLSEFFGLCTINGSIAVDLCAVEQFGQEFIA